MLRIVLALVGSSIRTVIDLLAAGSKVEGMNVRRLDVFFYGLFMDADALRAKGPQSCQCSASASQRDGASHQIYNNGFIKPIACSFLIVSIVAEPRNIHAHEAYVV